MAIFFDVLQGTPEWDNLRLGKFTASIMADLFATKTTLTYQRAVYRVAFEKLTGESPESFKSDYMARGNELEPLARESFEIQKGVLLLNGGFFERDEWFGCSPDGNLSDGSIAEIKCPAYNTMIDYLLKEKLPTCYEKQVQTQLLITSAPRCWFMAWHPKLKPLIIEVLPDKKIFELIENELEIAISKVEEIINKIKI